MSAKEEIILVTQDGCPFCKDTRKFLDKKGVDYEELNPEEYEKKYNKELDEVPFTCLIKGKKKTCVEGFDEEEINKLLE